jgi:hypothetical protein
MILFAYDASDLTTLLYSSDQTGQRDTMGNGVKFNTPTVANGHAYVGTQTTLEVFGLFDVATALPDAPTDLTAMSGPPAPTPPSIILHWVNHAANATGVRIERFNGIDFVPVSAVGRGVTTFTDTTVAASTIYVYRVVAVNQVGDSEPSNVASAKTHIGAPVLQVDDIFDTAVRLTWTATADDHYVVARATEGIPFTDIATVPAGTTTFTDTLTSFATYFYRVTAFNLDGDNAQSNTISATVGPTGVSHGGGFANHNDLTGNANTSRPIFQGTIIRLTDANNGEAGSVFTNTQVGIRRFTTSFTFQAQPGTVPMADGITFIIQGNSPMALGNSGGGMGYQGVLHSVAIKFDLFNHGHGGYSTGQYVDGHNPDVPSSGEADVSLVGTGIDLTSGHVFRVDLSYDGTKLTETITDTTNPALTFTIDDYPPVDIPAHVLGDTAFVGFGAGTGGLNAFQDILTWTYTENESGLPPRRPTNLHVTGISPVDETHFNIGLGWKANNAYTATGYRLERSTDGTMFTQIAQLPLIQTSYIDMNLPAGQYFYRARSFNASANSAYTPVLCVTVGSGGGIDHSTGFACSGDLNANGSAAFAGSNARLTDGGGSEAGSVFSLDKVDITHFTTSFKFQIHTPGTNPFADGMTFVIQNSNSGPTALGSTGGGLGYGFDAPGGARGIRNSIAIKFDIYSNAGEGIDSTGLFSDGRSPTVPEGGSGDVLVDLSGTPIDLNSQHVFQVDLTYDGTTLTETITDTATSLTFTTMYTVDIAGKVGGTSAFVGFTGGTGGLTATQDVQTWTFRNP